MFLQHERSWSQSWLSQPFASSGYGPSWVQTLVLFVLSKIHMHWFLPQLFCVSHGTQLHLYFPRFYLNDVAIGDELRLQSFWAPREHFQGIARKPDKIIILVSSPSPSSTSASSTSASASALGSTSSSAAAVSSWSWLTWSSHCSQSIWSFWQGEQGWGVLSLWGPRSQTRTTTGDKSQMMMIRKIHIMQMTSMIAS